jgi:ribonuclease-3
MAGEGRRRRLRALLDLAGTPNLELAAVEPAFVHSSAAAELGQSSNERLEFLGDSILGCITATWLYVRYPQAPEGELARRKAALASDEAIAATGLRLGLGELLMLGQGERASGGSLRASNIGDAFEAFIAVLERNVGIDTARRFVIREHLEPLADHYGPEADPKTMLQELLQARYRSTPVYLDEGEEGPPHLRTFQARVELNGKMLGSGRGASKKLAQRAAATDALTRLKEEAS